MEQDFPVCVLGKIVDMLEKRISGSWADEFRKDSAEQN